MNEMDNDQKGLSILVVSCDKYNDLWPVFFEMKKKNWSDCQYRTYLGTNEIKAEINDVVSICVGEDLSWADNVKKMLDSIKEDYVLMLLEDFFIDRKIDNREINNSLEFVKSKDIDCMRLEPLEPPLFVMNHGLRAGRLNPKAPYYVSTQPAIWKKNVLKELLKEGYSAWDFEQKNSNELSENAKVTYNFWGTKKYIFHHKNGVERGKYYLSTVNILRKNGITVDVEERGILNDKNVILKLKLMKYKFKMFVKRILAEFM